MSAKLKLIITITVVVFLLISSMLFVVSEGQEALILRLGKLTKSNTTPMGGQVYKAGLHVKLPIIDTVKIFDIRLQTLDIQSSRIMTAEKKDVIVDYYVKWKISDLPLYFKRTAGNVQTINTLLSQQLNDALRAQFGRRTIKDVVSDEREQIMTALNSRADASAASLGIQIVDVRIKRIDLPEEVSNAVYDRMRAERERVAKEHRSEGRAKAEAIRAQADADAEVIIANARAQGNVFRAQGDAKAGKIYVEAYSKNPEFYAFLRSLQAYMQSFSHKSDILVLTPESQFFQYFNYQKGASATAATQ
jgi:modulator of FtsH protease HflC